MKSTLTAVLLLLVGVMFALPSSFGVAEKAITELEYAWAGAQKDGKADVVDPMLAESFINTDADGHDHGATDYDWALRHRPGRHQHFCGRS